MKHILVGGITAAAIGVASMVMSIENNADNCTRYIAQKRASNYQSQPNPYDEFLTKNGYPNPTVKRDPMVESVEGTLNAYQGEPACGPAITSLQLLNAILTAILIFAVFVLPPVMFRSFFPSRGNKL